MTTKHEASEHYQEESVMESYDAQYNAPLRLWNLRSAAVWLV